VASVKITLKGFKETEKRLRKLTKPLNKGQAKNLANTIKDGMLAEILSGTSPISGKGPYKAYRGSYRKRIQAGRLGSKQLSPVNLQLSGDFLSDLKALAVKDPKGGFSSIVGYFTKLSRAKESGHREGVNKQAKRPTIPIGNERFNNKISKLIIQGIDAAIQKILRKR